MRRGTIIITHQQAVGLREAVRPLSNPPGSPIDSAALLLLHEKILFVLVEFDTGGDDTQELNLTRDDVLFINQFLSVQDGDWAAGVLKQARRALYELRTTVKPGYPEDTAKLGLDSLREQRDAEHDG